MSSGSSAHDGDGPWRSRESDGSSAHYPHRDDAMSGPGPYGPGRRNEPRDRREPQFGPDISWPNGFRQLDTDSRRVLESGYGRGAYDHVDPGYGTGGRGSGYRAPAADDYGDPGYSDPSYDGPRAGSGGGSGGHSWPDGSRGSRAPGGSGSVPGS